MIIIENETINREIYSELHELSGSPDCRDYRIIYFYDRCNGYIPCLYDHSYQRQDEIVTRCLAG